VILGTGKLGFWFRADGSAWILCFTTDRTPPAVQSNGSY